MYPSSSVREVDLGGKPHDFWSEFPNERLVIKEGIYSISNYAFSGLGVKNIVLPESLNYIGKYAFSNCWGLTTFTVPEQLYSIGEGAFSGTTSLTSINFNNNTNIELSDYVFAKTNIEEIETPRYLSYFGAGCFAYCNKLKKVTIQCRSFEIEDVSMFARREVSEAYPAIEHNIQVYVHPEAYDYTVDKFKDLDYVEVIKMEENTQQ